MGIEQSFLESEISLALKDNQFVLYYQPQFNLATSTFVGVEALIRWQHPTKGLILPKEFIPLAEKSDLIVEIGAWVLRTACAQMKTWQSNGLPVERMAVNVSTRQFMHNDFVDFVLNTLKEMDLDPTCLELELSEHMMVQEDDTRTLQMLNELKTAGILIALDDFGAENLDLNYLQRIPADRVKIDKTYIDNIHNNNNDAFIVKSLIKVAENLNLQIIAEGVETWVQLKMLLAHECKEIQGYYFSEPLPAEQIEAFLFANHKWK